VERDRGQRERDEETVREEEEEEEEEGIVRTKPSIFFFSYLKRYSNTYTFLHLIINIESTTCIWLPSKIA
jgi:hypothetical protein